MHKLTWPSVPRDELLAELEEARRPYDEEVAEEERRHARALMRQAAREHAEAEQ